jgi:outer membrane protein insertion porin family
MRFVVVVLISLLSCLAQTPARKKPAPPPKPAVQQPGDPTRPFPLASLKIAGNRIYPEVRILAAAGLKLGAPVSKEDFEAARERLIATGAFESVGLQFGPTADAKGYAGAFELVEVEQLYPYRFEGLPDTERHLRAALKEREPLFGDRIPATRQLLDRFAGGLKQYLGDAFKDKVAVGLEPTRPGDLEVVFRPGTPAPAIAEVEFIGNKALTASALHNALAAVAVGVAFREDVVRGLLETAIRPIYDGKGRLRVTFGNIETVPAKNVDGVRVKVTVDEGEVFNLGAIASQVPLIPAKKVLKLAALKSGDIADFDAVAKAIDAIQKELRREGYIRSHTETTRTLHEKEKTVDIAFTSALGTQFHMGKLKVAGLDVVTEPAIRKLWSLKEGDPYNADYPQYFLDRVKEEGWFDNLQSTRWDQAINEKTASVEVTLHFRGGTSAEEEKRKEEERKRQQEAEGPPIGLN